MRLPLITACAAALLVPAGAARAQLSLRQSEVVEGAYETIGNLLIDCPNLTGTCDNNTAVMAPVDVDTDSTTAMSSAATLNLPPGAVVRSAFLYVTGIGSETTAGTPPGAPWAPATLAGYPAKIGVGGASYTSILPVTATPVPGGEGYLARYDVASLVTSSGQYFVADALLAPVTHPYNRILTWVLFVSYDDGSPPFLVNLYDGYQNCFMGSTVLPFGGFRTPAAGTPRALFTAFSVDGHPTLAGESLTVGAFACSNAQNPVNNIGNGTVTSPSGPIPRVPATFRVSEEMDLDTFDVSNGFTNSQTSINVTFTCGALEGVVYGLATIGVAIVAPQIAAEKTVVDLNGGDAIAGDELQYEIEASNAGGDDAIEVVLRDPIPAGLTYVAGSIEYGTGTPVSKTDQAGDDEAEWTGGELVFRLGAGASATEGGTLAVGLSEVVRFRARIETTTAARTLVNRAFLSAIGAQGGSGATNIVRTSSISVVALPADAGVEPDAGILPDTGIEPDAGVVPDTGVEPDAGEPTPDAGVPVPDAGALADAGQVDLGTPAPDAGLGISVDAGEEAVDEEGCGCSALPVRAESGAGFALLAGLFLMSLRRRR